LRDTHYKGSKTLGHGQDYKYAHDFAGGFVDQDYLGVDKKYYEPTDRGYEAEIAQRLRQLRPRTEPPAANEGPADGS
jgi:putative ATPase